MGETETVKRLLSSKKFRYSRLRRRITIPGALAGPTFEQTNFWYRILAEVDRAVVKVRRHSHELAEGPQTNVP